MPTSRFLTQRKVLPDIPIRRSALIGRQACLVVSVAKSDPHVHGIGTISRFYVRDSENEAEHPQKRERFVWPGVS